MRESSCYLSRHAFFCLADDHYVFLDLRSDEYLCLGRTQSDEFRDLIYGHRRLDERSGVVRTLLEQGLLVEDEARGKHPAPPQVDTASTSLVVGADAGEAHAGRPAIGPAHVRKFFAAAAAASWNLRWQSIENTVRVVERRKRARRDAFAPADRATMVDLFAIFQALRPYYPRPYLCLFDSLALIHFLARFGVFPQWVYGVRLEPWGAHCWVQSGDTVVNDIVDNVSDYTPIMSI